MIEEAVFPIGDTAWALCETISENRKVKREFIQNNVKRPVLFLPGCQAPSALPDDWSIPPELCHKADIASAHFYGSVIHEFLSPFGSNAFILDAGAGLRRLPTQNVINMDIYDYPSTDILAIGEDLPFVDNAFDAVLSLAVLEHVKDPFRCAKELVRVTKPGGKIMSIIPFLQAEHGYPSHYANFTRHGIRELFKDGTVVENHFLERSNQPIFVLNQVLGLYASGLPGQVRERFLDMTVRELLSQSPDCYIDQEAPIVESLNEETRWIIASGTTLIVRKTSGS